MADHGCAAVLVDTVAALGTENDFLFLTGALNLVSIIQNKDGPTSNDVHIIVIVDDNSGRYYILITTFL